MPGTVLYRQMREGHRSQMQKYKLDIRKQWECIKDLCYMNKTKTVSHELLNLKVSAEESINNVNHYFSNIGSHIRTDGQPPPSTIQIISHHCKQAQNCSCLEVLPATEIKYLGVLLDNQLRWKPHIKSLSGRIRKLIYVFKTLRHVCDPSQLVSVYYALGQSIITYCISSWGGCPKSTLITLERAQRAVLKVLSFKPYRYPTIELYKETSVLTVRQCFIKTILLEQHKIPMPKNQHYDTIPTRPFRQRPTPCRNMHGASTIVEDNILEVLPSCMTRRCQTAARRHQNASSVLELSSLLLSMPPSLMVSSSEDSPNSSANSHSISIECYVMFTKC
ncbi:Uncharacterized protein OBRU01_19099 [Operophtera brumata]|uniref:Alkylated DNA repair protein AlkB homologue 8 N-terminal domain-containing protein n=1 Tax=Operophtera brumata TaxID=104452 RepID=A0A0L7KXZ6_OPEBR|nr:Uncharacterized protein OBRU01_19099 [Operophtera brumata]